MGTEIIVASWNMRDGNTKIDNLMRLTEELGADIFALQEVPENVMEYLEKNRDVYPYFACAIDHYMNGPTTLFKRVPSYLVILSKIQFANDFVRTHKRKGLRPLLARSFGWEECVEHHGVDIRINGELWRILNLHLGLADTFRNKVRQLKKVLRDHDPEGRTIMLGDFNFTVTLTGWHILPFLACICFGYSINDLVQNKANKVFARIIAQQELCDISAEHTTHKWTKLKLDRMCVPLKLVGKFMFWVWNKSHQSDHFPIVGRLSTTPDKN